MRMMSICLTWFLISGLGEPKLYHYLCDLTRRGILLGGLSDCEELVGLLRGDDVIGLGRISFLINVNNLSSQSRFCSPVFSQSSLLSHIPTHLQGHFYAMPQRVSSFSLR